MGLRTSRPLHAEDGALPLDDISAGHCDTQAETCWRYLIRKLYSVLGYQELSFNDLNRHSKRKRQISGEGDDGDIVNSHDLQAEEQPSQKMAKLDELLQEIVIVEQEDNHMPRPSDSLHTTLNIDESHQHLNYLDYHFLTDLDTMHYLSSSLTMVVMRGLPGSGKSTVVSAITRIYPHAVVCSADHFFMSEDGEYEFDASQLKLAHQQSQDKARWACEAGESLVVVDNTGVRRWELVPYFRSAQSYNYTVLLVEPRTPWRFNVKQLLSKNSHGVER